MGQAQTSDKPPVQQASAEFKSLKQRINRFNETSRANTDAAADILQVLRTMHFQRDPKDVEEGAEIALKEYKEWKNQWQSNSYRESSKHWKTRLLERKWFTSEPGGRASQRQARAEQERRENPSGKTAGLAEQQPGCRGRTQCCLATRTWKPQPRQYFTATTSSTGISRKKER